MVPKQEGGGVMAQMTKDMAERVIVHWRETGNHYGLTAWEECQLAIAWLMSRGHDIPSLNPASSQSQPPTC